MTNVSVYETAVSGFASEDAVKMYLAYNKECEKLKTFFVNDQYQVVSELERNVSYNTFVIRNSAKPVLDGRASKIQRLANW